MTTLASEIINTVRVLLNDNVAEYRHGENELLRWISDAQREIVRFMPESYPQTVPFLVDKRTPYQELSPDTVTAFIRVEANYYTTGGGEGGTDQWGDVVRRVDHNVLNSFSEVWGYSYSYPDAAANSYFKEWAIDPMNALAFYVHPAPDQTDILNPGVWITYAGMPVELTAPTDPLTLSELYDYATINYVLYRAMSNQSATYSEAGATAALARFGADLKLDRDTIKALGGKSRRAAEELL